MDSLTASHYVYVLGVYRITVARHKPFIHPKTVREALNVLDEIIVETPFGDTQE
jgi:hypothetical protein